MSVLVTGGAGYVGSHTVKELSRRGWRVIVFDNLSRGHREAARYGDLVEGDLADEKALAELFSRQRIEAVLHFAALAYVGESVADPRRYYEGNVGNTLKLLGAMLDHGVSRFILSSTCAVYGEPERLPLTEDHPLRPINPYGMSKLVIERVLSDYDRAYGLRYISLRYFNAAGADPEGELGERHEPETHLIPRLLLAALGRLESVEIFGADYPTADGTCVRDYVHVSDLATAHARAVEWLLDGGPSETFNVGTGRGHTVMEVVEACRRVAGRPIEVPVGPRRPGDPAVLVCSNERVRQRLGWEPRFTDLEEIVATAWKWHRRARLLS